MKLSTKLTMISLLAMASASATAGDAAAGKAKFAACAGCHGANGVSADEALNPSVAGLSADAVKTALNEYKSGARDHVTMNAMSAGLSDADIDNLAAYITTLKK